jgi:hypothetical protein
VEVVFDAGDLTIGCLRLAGAPPGHHGHRRLCCCALEAQLVPPSCARERGESTGVSLVAGEVAIGEHSPVNGCAHRSQRGRPRALLSATAGRGGAGEERISHPFSIF